MYLKVFLTPYHFQAGPGRLRSPPSCNYTALDLGLRPEAGKRREPAWKSKDHMTLQAALRPNEEGVGL